MVLAVDLVEELPNPLWPAEPDDLANRVQCLVASFNLCDCSIVEKTEIGANLIFKSKLTYSNEGER